MQGWSVVMTAGCHSTYTAPDGRRFKRKDDARGWQPKEALQNAPAREQPLLLLDGDQQQADETDQDRPPLVWTPDAFVARAMNAARRKRRKHARRSDEISPQ